MVGGIVMNENLDLTKILDGCPKGTKLYSAIYGDVTLFEVDSSGFYPIRLSGIVDGEICNLIFATEDGKSLYGIGECTLFPSKDQRDWSKFERFWDKPKVERFDPKTLQPFDRILARDYGNDTWTACLFSHHADELDNDWYVCDNTYWRFVIPYNDDTKHLVGTKNDCSEYYKWWKE